MREEKNENKIDDKFFGRDEAVSDSIRPFLSHKNFTKIAEAEKNEIADVRARLAELYEPASGKIRKIQTGVTQFYAFIMMLGIVVALFWIIMSL